MPEHRKDRARVVGSEPVADLRRAEHLRPGDAAADGATLDAQVRDPQRDALGDVKEAERDEELPHLADRKRRDPGEEEDEGHQDEHERRRGLQGVRARVKVEQSLHEPEARAGQRVGPHEDLQRARRPAQALLEDSRDVVWREPRLEVLVEVHRREPGRSERLRGEVVLGDRAIRLAPDRHEGGALEHAARAAAAHGIGAVPAGLQRPEKQPRPVAERVRGRDVDERLRHLEEARARLEAPGPSRRRRRWARGGRRGQRGIDVGGDDGGGGGRGGACRRRRRCRHLFGVPHGDVAFAGKDLAVAVPVRCLSVAGGLALHEMAERPREELGVGQHVAVDHDDKVLRDARSEERRVDVARLGVVPDAGDLGPREEGQPWEVVGTPIASKRRAHGLDHRWHIKAARVVAADAHVDSVRRVVLLQGRNDRWLGMGTG